MNRHPKAALVFGGSRGLGAGIVRRLAADGFTVAFTYVSRADAASELVRSIESLGGRGLAIEADSGDEQDIRRAVEHAVRDLGPLSTVVVNAGILRTGSIENVPVEDLDAMLRVNVRGVFLAIQAVVPHMAAGGSIVTIGSNVAVRGSAGSSVYQMTKAAVAAMVRGVALDLAERDITVNNVQPGPFATDMNEGSIDALAARSPMRRVGDVDEIGGIVAYLASTDARYVTGAAFTIDGGWSV